MGNEPATANQIRVLKQILPEDDKKGPLSNLSKGMAYLMIRDHHDKPANLPATYPQEKYLRGHPQWRDGMKRGEADCITQGSERSVVTDRTMRLADDGYFHGDFFFCETP